MLKYFCHAQERAFERYGIYLTMSQIRTLEKRIYNGDADYIGMGVNGTSMWSITYEQQTLYPLIDFEASIILTFLTKKMVNRNIKAKKYLAI